MDSETAGKLRGPLDPRRVITGTSGPLTGVRYLEGHDCIYWANEIFGFGEWSFELVGQPWVLESGEQGAKGTAYEVWAAVGRLTAGGVTFQDIGTNVRQGGGSGGLEMAIKGAVTDAMKRCLRNYGNQFGLVLYDKRVSMEDLKRWWNEAHKDKAAPAVKTFDPDAPEHPSPDVTNFDPDTGEVFDGAAPAAMPASATRKQKEPPFGSEGEQPSPAAPNEVQFHMFLSECRAMGINRKYACEALGFTPASAEAADNWLHEEGAATLAAWLKAHKGATYQNAVSRAADMKTAAQQPQLAATK